MKDRYGRTFNAANDKAMRRFAENIDMESFEWICNDSGNDKLTTLVTMMHDPAYALSSFMGLAKRCSLTLQELQVAYTDGMRHIGLLKLATHLPDIIEDVAVDAHSTMEVCPRCDGYQVVPAPDKQTRDCPVCRGAGEVKRMGDRHARDLIFESAKLTKQGGPMVQINQAFVGDTRMETMLKRTREIVLKPNKPLDSPSGQE